MLSEKRNIINALTVQYIVIRWPDSQGTATQQATITVTVNAANHLEALEFSGLKEPGVLISVNVVGGLKIRYQIDSDGKAVELARYGSKE